MIELKSRIEKVYNPNILFLFIITILVLKKYTNIIITFIFGSNNNISIYLYMAFAVLLALSLIFGKLKKEEIYFLIFSIIITILTKESSILIYFILAIAAKSVKNENIAKYYFYINLVFFISIIIGNITGILPETEFIHYRENNGVLIPRKDFSFGNPNAVFFNLMPIYMGYIFIRFEKYNFIDRFILLFTSIVFYYTTYSRTGFLIIITILISVDVIRYIDIKNKYIAYTIKLVPIIIMISSIIIGTIMKDNNILNNILSNRPMYWNVYLENPSLFGNNYSWEIRNMYPVDNSYMYIYAIGGIVSALTWMFILYNGLSNSIKKGDKKVIIIAIAFLMYGFGENILFDKALNFSFILLLKNINLISFKEIVNRNLER